MTPPRILRLRRPAVLTMHPGPFVPDVPPEKLQEAEARWVELCNAKPHSFDGRTCHVLGVHRNGCGGAVVHAVDCAFRYHAVQDQAFDLGVRILGIKGIVCRGGDVLVGRRSAMVGTYSGLWEFAPGGVVEPGEDPASVVVRELTEETGLTSASPPIPIAICYDPVARTWEVVFRMEPVDGQLRPQVAEYDRLAWLPPGTLASSIDMSPVAQQMLTLVPEIGIRATGYQQPNSPGGRNLD